MSGAEGAADHVVADEADGGTTFDRTTSLRALGEEHRWAVDLDEAWSSLRGIHGGYLSAIAVRAFEQAHGDRPVRTVHVSFVRAGQVGPAVVSLDTVRRGTSSAVARVAIEQGGGPVLAATITGLAARGVGTDGSAGPAWTTPIDDGPAPMAECDRMLVPPSVRHFDHARALLDPANVPFRSGSRARLAGYVRPAEPRLVDAPWLTMLLDWFPPSPFARHDRPIGGVSVDYTVHLHRLPVETGLDGWLTFVTEARDAADGLALEHGRVRDAAGRMVAESFHTRLLSVNGAADVVRTLR